MPEAREVVGEGGLDDVVDVGDLPLQGRAFPDVALKGYEVNLEASDEKDNNNSAAAARKRGQTPILARKRIEETRTQAQTRGEQHRQARASASQTRANWGGRNCHKQSLFSYDTSHARQGRVGSPPFGAIASAGEAEEQSRDKNATSKQRRPATETKRRVQVP